MRKDFVLWMKIFFILIIAYNHFWKILGSIFLTLDDLNWPQQWDFWKVYFKSYHLSFNLIAFGNCRIIWPQMTTKCPMWPQPYFFLLTFFLSLTDLFAKRWLVEKFLRKIKKYAREEFRKKNLEKKSSLKKFTLI